MGTILWPRELSRYSGEATGADVKDIKHCVVTKALCYKPEGRGIETRSGE
jgi:hypothetical protein